MNDGHLAPLLKWATDFQLNRPWPEEVKPEPMSARRKKNGTVDRRRLRPRHINKVKSIKARCKDCGTLLVMRVQWRPEPILEFAEELLKTVKTCHECGRTLEKPDLSSLRLTLSKED